MSAYVFAFVLFVVNFLISLIFIHAANERKKMMRIQEQIKRLTISSEKENARLNESSQHAVEKIDQKILLAQNAMRELGERIEDVQSRSGDLAKLQATLSNYRRVMDQLATLTEQAEARIQEIRGDIEEVGKVRQTIAQFQEETAKEKEAIASMRLENENSIKALLEEAKSSVDTSTKTLKECEQSFTQLHEQTSAQIGKELSDYTSSCSEKMQQLFKQTIEQIDSTFHTMVSTSQVFINELDGRIASAKDVASSLDVNSSVRLEDAARKLSELAIQISNNKSIMATEENLKRQMDESIKELQVQADALHVDIARLKGEKTTLLEKAEPQIEDEQPQEEDEEPLAEDEWPQEEDAVPQLEDVLSQAEDTQPQEKDAVPQLEDVLSQAENVQPQVEKPSYVPVGEEESISLDD